MVQIKLKGIQKIELKKKSYSTKCRRCHILFAPQYKNLLVFFFPPPFVKSPSIAIKDNPFSS